MKMKILKSETRVCTCCMEQHQVKTVQIKEQATFKNRKVSYDANYLYYKGRMSAVPPLLVLLIL